MKNTLFKIQCTIVAVVLIAAICFIDYGVKNDCPDTAGYFSCAKVDK